MRVSSAALMVVGSK